ncbi:hypothetical protein C0U41_29740, partial [Klebsiella pneumoniae]
VRCHARVERDQPIPAVPKWGIKKWISLPGEQRPPILSVRCHARVERDQPIPAVPKWGIKKWISLPGEQRP